MKPLATQFVIADAGRARWVKRSEGSDAFVTFRELKAEPEAQGGPNGVLFASRPGQRATPGEAGAAIREHRLRFARQVAEAINAEAQAGGLGRLAVVAPARMLAAIRQRLDPPAYARLARTLSRDLTKTPDHQLAAWLRPLERG